MTYIDMIPPRASQLRHNWQADNRVEDTPVRKWLHALLREASFASHFPNGQYALAAKEFSLVMNDAVNEFSKSRIGGVIVLVLRAIGVALGLFLLAIAVPLFFLPIPLGLPLFILSALLLAASSQTAHGIVTGVLKRFPPVWNRVKRMFGDKD